MMKNPRYETLKELYTNGCSGLEALAYLPAYFLGAGKWTLFFVTLVLYIVLNNVLTRVWYRSMEKMSG